MTHDASPSAVPTAQQLFFFVEVRRVGPRGIHSKRSASLILRRQVRVVCCRQREPKSLSSLARPHGPSRAIRLSLYEHPLPVAAAASASQSRWLLRDAHLDDRARRRGRFAVAMFGRLGRGVGAASRAGGDQTKPVAVVTKGGGEPAGAAADTDVGDHLARPIPCNVCCGPVMTVDP